MPFEREPEFFYQEHDLNTQFISTIFIGENLNKPFLDDQFKNKENKLENLSEIYLIKPLRESLFRFKENYTELSLLNTRILEDTRANRRADDFIIRELQRWNRQHQPRPLGISERVVNIPTYQPVRDKSSFRSSTGLSVQVVSNSATQLLTVNGEHVEVPTGAHTRIDFTPSGRFWFDKLKITDSLTKGIQGVMELLDAIDKGEVEPEEVFVGNTNINMALIAQRLGFVIVDQCRTPEGQIDKSLRTFTVVGKLSDIKRRVSELQEEQLPERLASRNQRLQLRSALSI